MPGLLEEIQAVRELPSPADAKAIREAAGVSRYRAAREIGVADLTLARWEAGLNHPRGAAAIAWADLLDALRALGSG
jgi:DNA-binding transcriptional regulator YiaG